MADFRPVPRRSALYVPGSNLKALDKARTLDADVLIFDLEDAVHTNAKDAARDQLMAALKKGGYRSELVVRINPLASKLGQADIKAAARSGCQAVLLPKVESAKDVRDAALRLAAAGAPENVQLWAMIETPLGVLRAQEIALSSPHLGALVMGTSDLVKDLRARLESRAQDSKEVIKRRLSNAYSEISRWDGYDYVLVNEDLDACYQQLRAIITAERLRRQRQPWLPGFVQSLLKEDT